jgi:hypothetical protein
MLLSIPYRPALLISGGQTGADFGGLLGAEDCGIPTGGIAPKGYKTEKGPMPELGARFGLTESKSEDYAVRTRENLELADAVIIVARNFLSPGTVLTDKLCLDMGVAKFPLIFASKPSGFPLYWAQDLKLWLEYLEPAVLMIAGNRESKAPGIEVWTRNLIKTIFA